VVVVLGGGLRVGSGAVVVVVGAVFVGVGARVVGAELVVVLDDFAAPGGPPVETAA